ncbi:MAG: hypothetical protein ABI700_00735 [Chloroflexota bacterium]
MAQRCTTCAHPDHVAIDKLLVNGAPSVEIARQYGLNERAVRRHAETHLPATLVQAAQSDADLADLDVLTEVKRLYNLTMGVLKANEKDGKMSLAAIREARPILALLGELLGQLDRRPQVNVLISPQWITIRAEVLKALIPYPEARAAVAAALLEVETVSTRE